MGNPYSIHWRQALEPGRRPGAGRRHRNRHPATLPPLLFFERGAAWPQFLLRPLSRHVAASGAYKISVATELGKVQHEASIKGMMLQPDMMPMR